MPVKATRETLLENCDLITNSWNAQLVLTHYQDGEKCKSCYDILNDKAGEMPDIVLSFVPAAVKLKQDGQSVINYPGLQLRQYRSDKAVIMRDVDSKMDAEALQGLTPRPVLYLRKAGIILPN